jgi:hypothetical protein
MDLYNKHENQQGVGLTYDLWKNFPTHEIFALKDASVGVGCMLDPANPPFAKANAGAYSTGEGIRMFTDTTAIISGLTWATGGRGMRLFTSADNEAAEIQWGGGGEPFIISDTAADAKELIMEVHFRIDTITTNDLGLFIGLAGTHAMDGDFLVDNVPTAATPGVADIDMFGLFMDHADTTGLDIMYQLAGQTAVTHEAAWKTLAADTWYAFGMRYLPNQKKVDFYWGSGDRTTTAFAKDDNPIVAADIASAGADKFPDGQGLAPTIAIKGGHADDATLDIRLFACAQRAAAAT